MCAIWIANLIRWKREGYKPDRDIIVALTADEEGGKFNGVDWLLKNHRPLIDAELCINEGGWGDAKNGKPFFAAETPPLSLLDVEMLPEDTVLLRYQPVR